MRTIDFTKTTACGECCVGCKKKDEGLCEGCIESDGRCKEWAQSGECPIHRCAKNHGVQFCGLCDEFPCEELPEKIHWNPNVVEHLYDEYIELFETIWKDRALYNDYSASFSYEAEDITIIFSKID